MPQQVHPNDHTRFLRDHVAEEHGRYAVTLQRIAMLPCAHIAPYHPYGPDESFCPVCEARIALGWPNP